MVRDKQHGPVLELNRIQVKRSRGKGGLAGPDGVKSVFGQMSQQICVFTPDSLMLPHRIWKVKFVGEWSLTSILKNPTDLHMSLCMRKPTICIGENKAADQLRGNRESDQCLCFRYTYSTIPLLLKYKISSL